jgi:hypothetical protein
MEPERKPDCATHGRDRNHNQDPDDPEAPPALFGLLEQELSLLGVLVALRWWSDNRHREPTSNPDAIDLLLLGPCSMSR